MKSACSDIPVYDKMWSLSVCMYVCMYYKMLYKKRGCSIVSGESAVNQGWLAKATWIKLGHLP